MFRDGHNQRRWRCPHSSRTYTVTSRDTHTTEHMCASGRVCIIVSMLSCSAVSSSVQHIPISNSRLVACPLRL